MAMNTSLKNSVEFIAKSMGMNSENVKAVAEEVTAEQKELRAKGATDPMSTSNTGYGAELTNAVQYKDELYSMVIEDKQNIFGQLPGNHGEVNAPSVQVSVKGKVDKFKGGSERTSISSNYFETLNSNNSMATDKVTIGIKKYSTMIAISKEELQYSTDRSLFSTIQNKIVQAAARTQTAALFNGDTQTNTATGNVNHKDSGTPVSLDTTQYYLKNDNGLRKLGITNGKIGGAVAFDSSVYKEMQTQIGDYASDYENLMRVLGNTTGVNAKYVPGYREVQQIGQDLATLRNGRLPAYIEGIEAYYTTEMPKLVNTDGYVLQGTTATANNTQGSLLLFYKPAVQFAFGMPMQIVTHETSGDFLIDVSMWFGFTVANAQAGLDKTVSYGIVNI